MDGDAEEIDGEIDEKHPHGVWEPETSRISQVCPNIAYLALGCLAYAV
jgi:hypothetical protein